MITPESPIFLTVGSYSIRYYGLIMFFAIMTGFVVMNLVAKKYYKDIDTEKLLDIMPFIIICAIIGARAYYVSLDWSYYSKHLNEIIAIWNGGLSIHGGLLGGIVSGLIICKKEKLNFLKYADLFSFGLIIGQAIGRFGNYFNAEAFGKPCSIPFLQLYIPLEKRPIGLENIEYYHPTFLYESLWNIFVFIVLLIILNRYKNIKTGTMFFGYLILYSIGRFFIEWCRLDSVLNIYNIPIAQIISIITIVISIIAIVFINKKSK